MPYKVFQVGAEALAADMNNFLMEQTVARFTSAAQRSADLVAPELNQLTMLDSRPGVVQYWTGSAWSDIDKLLQSGSVNLTPNASGVATVTLPRAFASAAFNVVAVPYVSSPQNVCTSIIPPLTASSFQVGFTHAVSGAPVTTPLDIQWIAVGAYP